MKFNLIENCSKKHLYPWLHYEIENYFNDELIKDIKFYPVNQIQEVFDIVFE